MKETITGLQEALDKKGIKIKLKPKDRSDALVKAAELDKQKEQLEQLNRKLYREERVKYFMRLKNCQTIGQIERARRTLLGISEPEDYKEIDKEIKKGMGFKDDD